MIKNQMLLDLLLLLVTLILTLVIFYTWKYDYWRKRGIPYEKAVFPFGSIKEGLLLRKPLWSVLNEFYYKYSEYKYFGVYFGRHPRLVIRDPELTRAIYVKHFNEFHDKTIDINPNSDPLAANNPAILKGNRWKTTRAHLTPTFTALKLKQVYNSMASVSDRLVAHLQKHIDTSNNGLELKNVVGSFATEVFTLCGLSIKSDSFENPNSPFKAIARQIFEVGTFSGFITLIFMVIDPPLSVLVRTRLITKEASEYFKNAIQDVLTHREKNNADFNDFFSHFHKLYQKNDDFTKDDLISNVVTLFIDGVQTTSTVVKCALYEIAANPEIFKRLREEIDTVANKYDNKLTFEGIQEMTYLDCCFIEALRLYSVVLFSMRNCTNTFELPPIKEGGATLKIEKGIAVILPTYSIHHDPILYPNPDVYNPERFNNDETKAQAKANFFGFGDGPRICLGMRYGTLVSKLAVSTIIQNFDVVLNEKSKERPKNIGPSFIYVPSEEPFVNFYKRGEIYKSS